MDITSSYLSSDFTPKFTPAPFFILVLWKVWLCDHQGDAPGRPPRAESMTGQGPLLCIEIHHCAGPEVSPSMGCSLPMPKCSRDTQAAHSLQTLDSFVGQFRLRYSKWLKHSGLWCFQPNCSTYLSLGWYNKTLQPKWVINNRNVHLMVLEAEVQDQGAGMLGWGPFSETQIFYHVFLRQKVVRDLSGASVLQWH